MKPIRTSLFLLTIATLAGCSSQPQNVETELSSPVSVTDIKPQTIRKFINTSGTVYAVNEATLNSEMEGRYSLRTNPATGRPFRLGDRVRKGQVIIRLENEEYENGIAIESKQLQLELSEQEYQKQESLYEKGGVTLRELRDAEVSMTSARYSYQTALLQLDKMNITAPFDGIVVELPFYTQNVTVSTGSLMSTIMDYSDMYMEINLPEKNLTEVEIGQEVWITNYNIPDDTIVGVVNELSPVVSSETRTFKGKLQIENPALKLRPGMFVKADIVVTKKDSVIVISKDVIISGTRGRTVFVVDRNAARERRIETGIENSEQVEVVSGLSINDQLVTSGYETLRNGSRVNIVR
ncbi:MAG: efflux RND transporter periplasmic adaptor subunit [Bacteroidales bacterium]|nr:efflux RND transporter periplasmic adaptor subunit [Bacteroidales bacterium]